MELPMPRNWTHTNLCNMADHPHDGNLRLSLALQLPSSWKSSGKRMFSCNIWRVSFNYTEDGTSRQGVTVKGIACLEYGLITRIQQDPEVSISSSLGVCILALLYCRTLCCPSSRLNALFFTIYYNFRGKSTVSDGLILPTIRYLYVLYMRT